MTKQNVKIIFTKSTTIRGSRKKIDLAQAIVNSAKLENSEYFKKVTEALKQVPHEDIQTKSISY
jgi:hypothetical protein